MTAEHGGPGIERSPHRRALARLVAPRVDRVVGVSASQIPDLRRLGYRPDAIRIVPNGSAEPALTTSRRDLRRELGLTEDEIVVLLVATLRPEKRADVFVDAVAAARGEDERVRGVIAGAGQLLEEIRRRASATGDGILVLGERPDIPDLMNCADIVCLTSDVEGMPLAALEAMSVGRPLIATAVGGMRELVEPSRTGLLVHPGDPRAFADSILELARDPCRRSAMGDEARVRHLAKHTAELMIERYADVLSELTPPSDRHSTG